MIFVNNIYNSHNIKSYTINSYLLQTEKANIFKCLADTVEILDDARFLLLVPAAKRGTSLGLPRVFFFYLCRVLQPLDVILDILD